jgi:hypothetical protein
MPGTLAGSKIPALIPASPAPMTATLNFRTWSMQRPASSCSFEIGYWMGSTGRKCACSVSCAGARWLVNCATRLVEVDD